MTAAISSRRPSRGHFQPETITYTYGADAWQDLLTGYGGETFTYDEIGNPLTWRGGMTLSWQNGRQLQSASAGGKSLSFAYNADGIRTQKTVDGVTTRYTLNGTQVLAQQTGTDAPIYFTYDASGRPYSMTCGGTTVYYLCNLSGDVFALLDADGNRIVEYTYGPFGQLLGIYGTAASTLGAINPLRYRGYYYDAETGLYYLNSRYYDPEVGRFINADGYVSTGQGILGYNMFAYCLNNPVNMSDSSGEIAVTTLILIGSIGAGCLMAGHTAGTSYKYTGEVDVGNTILSGLSTFALCYTWGMSAYGLYVSYCDYKGYVPVTNVGPQKPISSPYSNLSDPPNVGPGKDFTASQKNQIIQQNKIVNKGVVRSDLSGRELVKPQKSMKGITPSMNEWQIDHIIPKSAGGTNSFSNAQVLSREENRIKWDKTN